MKPIPVIDQQLYMKLINNFTTKNKDCLLWNGSMLNGYPYYYYKPEQRVISVPRLIVAYQLQRQLLHCETVKQYCKDKHCILAEHLYLHRRPVIIDLNKQDTFILKGNKLYWEGHELPVKIEER